MADNEIIPSDIARDVQDILAGDSDQSEPDWDHNVNDSDHFNFHQIGNINMYCTG